MQSLRSRTGPQLREERRVTVSAPVFADVPGAEPESLEDFLERVRPRLKQVLKSYNIPYSDAEDVLQEALLGALRNWETIRNLEAWLIGTLGFLCAKYWRQRRKQEVAMALEVLEDFAEAQAPAQEQVELLLDLGSLTRGLCKRHRAALWLRCYVEMSPGEVARQLGYRPSTVRTVVRRCLRSLQGHRHVHRSQPLPSLSLGQGARRRCSP